jgi:hypothetical protein
MDSPDDKFTQFRDYVLDRSKKGIAVLMTPEGVGEINLEDLINQPAEGILYDLNRDPATVLTFIKDPKWVNDYAVGLVISRLKNMLDQK